MTVVGWLQIILILAAVVAFAIPLGAYMGRVFAGERTFLSPVLGPVERGFYKVSGIDPAREQGWLAYTLAMLAFNAAGFLLLYLLLRLQAFLPLNPQGFSGMSPHLAFNTAVSFVTNTNWQSYGGETTLSHLSQMAGLTVQNSVEIWQAFRDGYSEAVIFGEGDVASFLTERAEEIDQLAAGS